MSRVLPLALGFLLVCSGAQAQFSSGSTGADGALTVPTGSACPGGGATVATNTCRLILPPSGIKNYTTIMISAGWTLQVRSEQKPVVQNKPAILLATGNVMVAGTLALQSWARNEYPAPGGYRGGLRGPGFGPGGGGYPSTASNYARWVGPVSLVPIVGGSGGASYSTYTTPTYGGGNGGGALTLASSGSVTVSGSVVADGDDQYSGVTWGSGGAIRVVANSISIPIGGVLSARTGGGGTTTSDGVIRLEAPAGQVTLYGNSTPAAVISTINSTIIPSGAPTLTITSVGGVTVPTASGTLFSGVDVLLPAQQVDPISLVVRGTGVPVGTTVNLTISGPTGYTVTPAVLTGTTNSSTATPQVSGLSRAEASYIYAFVVFDVPGGGGNPPGPDHVARLRLDVAPGEPSRPTFLRDDGTVVESTRVPPSLLEWAGLMRQ